MKRRHHSPEQIIRKLREAEWMLGQTLVGSRLRDVRSVLRHLRTRADLDAGRVAVWGDSFAPANPADMTEADLAGYAAKIRPPVSSTRPVFAAPETCVVPARIDPTKVPDVL